MFLTLIYSIALLALIIGSWTDIRTREVPDWLNHSLVFLGLGIRLIFSLALWDFSYILSGLAGYIAFLLLAYFMFYTGQWGGGDSKMLMGLGAILGLEFTIGTFILAFFINALFVGAVYGLVWSFYLGLKNRKKFFKEFKRILNTRNYVRIRMVLLIFIALMFISLFFITDIQTRLAIISLMLILSATFYVWVVVKSVEKVAMYKLVPPEKLTEGDWIAKDVKVNGKYICGPKDLGIEMKQIKKLIALKKKNKIKTILIKEGIPFVPSFLLAFLFTLVFGNLILNIILF